MRTPIPSLGGHPTRLRQLAEQDTTAIVEQCLDPETQKWTRISADFSAADAEPWIRHVVPDDWRRGRAYHLAVEHEGRYAGSVSLRPTGPGTAEISYGLHPDFRGRSISQAALNLLLDWAFAELDLETIQWLCPVGNWASRKVAWRLGFNFVGILPGWLPFREGTVDAWAGSLMRTEPRAPRGEWLDVPTINSDLVRLRRVRTDDLERIVAGANDPLSQEWIRKIAVPFTMTDAESYLNGYEEGMATGSAVHWAMADPTTDNFLGTMSVLRIARPQGEIGYWAHPEARGRGLVTKAAELAIRYAFSDLGLQRLCLYAATENVPSRLVAERNGFVRVGTERQIAHRRNTGLVDCEVYDLLPTDLM
ncbi:MAG TPA: GNAT family N-acetyltransferase [Marmoricola sp.]|nr:GNAT family N-acetyltransferase [Marmoricola sp.]HNO39682.1 GNAT family N-acetyltransferase [Marmoricola sp.]